MPRARRKMRRRNVARVAVGSAVIAGTAGAVHHHQNKRYSQQDYEEQQEMYEQQEQYEEQAPPPPAQPAQDDMVSQLERLAALKDQGILTEEEFAAQKAKLLGL